MKVYRMVLIASLAVAVVFTGILSGIRMLVNRETASMGSSAITIVVDAGHGGEDGGATSVTGVQESKINLEIAQKLDDFLGFSGFSTVMVRESDTAIYDASAATISQKKVSDLKNRVKLVNQTPNPLLLSIHQNLFEDGRYFGAQVFYAKTDGSRELAETAQQALIDIVDPQNHRQPKPADTVYLMNNIQCPAILVECGFLSNRSEDQKLQDAAYQKKLTLAISYALSNWVNERLEMDEV